MTSNYRNSEMVNKIVYETPVLSTAAKDVTNTFKDMYDLTDEVINENLDKNEANLRTIDIMLKYDLVTPKTVEQLVVLDKLKGIKGLEPIIQKYK